MLTNALPRNELSPFNETPSRLETTLGSIVAACWSSHSSSGRSHFRSPVLKRTTPHPITFSFRRSPLALGRSFAFCYVALLRPTAWRRLRPSMMGRKPAVDFPVISASSSTQQATS